MNERLKTKSGLDGWQGYLQDQYSGLGEFRSHDEVYGLSERLGYDSSTEAWEANPLIQGSTNPDDYCRIFKPDELPVAVKVIVALEIGSTRARGDGLPEWKIREAAEQAVENAVKMGYDNGFNHDHDEVSASVVSVETAGNALESA